jgi:hypothetical protein
VSSAHVPCVGKQCPHTQAVPVAQSACAVQAETQYHNPKSEPGLGPKRTHSSPVQQLRIWCMFEPHK